MILAWACPFKDMRIGNESNPVITCLRYHAFYQCINPLSPYDALKHRFTSLKTDLISL